MTLGCRFYSGEKTNPFFEELDAHAVVNPDMPPTESMTFEHDLPREKEEMQKIGNNINQLAHYANICIKSGVVSEAVVQEMNQTIGELTKIEIKLEDIMRRIVKG